MISVIIPVYNADKHIDETIKSVLKQTYANFELIIINDGSTDRSLEIISGHADPRIKIFSQDNYGVSYSRNKGAYLAKNEYLAFLDSDDIWHPEYLDKKLDHIRNSDSDMVFCYEQEINENYDKLEKYFTASEIDFFEKIITIHPDYAVGPSNLFIKRRSFLSSVGFNQALSNTADKMMLIDLLHEFKYSIINEVLLYYKTHGSNMHKNIKKTKTDFQFFKQFLCENYFNDNKNAELRKVFNSRYRLMMAYYSLRGYRFILCLINIFRSFTASPETFLNYLAVKNRSRKLIFSLLFNTGLFTLLYRTTLQRNKKPIALFHRVSPLPDHIWAPLKPHEFENIILLFKKHFSLVSLDDFLMKKDLPANAMCIVFDDGFLDFKNFSLPILKKHDIPVSLFVPTGLIEKEQQIWTYELGTLIRLSPQKRLEFNFGNYNISFDISNERGKNNCSRELITLFKELTVSEMNEALNKVKIALGNSSQLGQRLMTTQELKELSPGVSIHSHSADHYYLSRLNDKELETTLNESLDYIKKNFAHTNNFIAYPIGDYNETVVSEVKSRFDFGFIVSDRNVDFNTLANGSNKYKIPRFNIHHNNPIEVLFKLVGFHKFFSFNKKVDY